jgi:hypothetical protein
VDQVLLGLDMRGEILEQPHNLAACRGGIDGDEQVVKGRITSDVGGSPSRKSW